MRKILPIIVGLFFIFSTSYAEEKLDIQKQLVGIVGAISGTVKTETRDLKAGDKIYLNETIYATEGSGTQILLLDQSTFTIGSDSEVVMDTFIYDPATNDGKIVANVKKGSLKVISGLISKKNPDSLTVEVPEGTLGSRGTEFQTIVGKKKTDTLLIGPGKNNTLGLRPGAVLVGNKFGNTMLKNPYSMASMTKGKAPGKAKQITKNQLKKFNKKMRALKVAKLDDGATKEEKKALRKEIRKELKEAGLDKEEIKTLIKDNIQKDQEKRIVLLEEREANETFSEDGLPEDIVQEEIEIEQEISVDEPSVEPKVDEPKVAEPKVVEPKVVEPKIAEPKVADPKKVKEKKVDKKKKKKVKKKKGKKKKGKKAKKKKGKKKKAKAKKAKAKKKKAVKKKKSVKKKKVAKKKKAVKKKAKKKKKKVVKKKKKKKVVKKRKKVTKKKIAKKKKKAKKKRKRKK